MNDFRSWYDALDKPSWTPASSTIGTIWTILYPILFIVNGYVIMKYLQKQISFVVLLPFLINLAANFAFTPVQFGLRNLELASAVILIVLTTAIWSCIAIYPTSKIASLACLPYIIWVATASVLQLTITIRN